MKEVETIFLAAMILDVVFVVFNSCVLNFLVDTQSLFKNFLSKDSRLVNPSNFKSLKGNL